MLQLSHGPVLPILPPLHVIKLFGAKGKQAREPGSTSMLQKNILKPFCHLLCFQRN